ncbi:hypothetical protein HC766_04175 [Candidatus Gracilibacteria bacterium]|nr:hypothetical protein [Candidatus Gracilibacteria bacterium]NJS41524.1 hypothetical protein [Candidatus Gracilibacteria bacterium]
MNEIQSSPFLLKILNKVRLVQVSENMSACFSRVGIDITDIEFELNQKLIPLDIPPTFNIQFEFRGSGARYSYICIPEHIKNQIQDIIFTKSTIAYKNQDDEISLGKLYNKMIKGRFQCVKMSTGQKKDTAELLLSM